jgi:hypothetical protein
MGIENGPENGLENLYIEKRIFFYFCFFLYGHLGLGNLSGEYNSKFGKVRKFYSKLFIYEKYSFSFGWIN